MFRNSPQKEGAASSRRRQPVNNSNFEKNKEFIKSRLRTVWSHAIKRSGGARRILSGLRKSAGASRKLSLSEFPSLHALAMLLRSNTIFPSNVAELGVDFLFKGVNFNSAQYAGAISDILKELGLSSVSLGNGKRPAYLYISNKVAFNNSLADRYLKSFSDDDQIANWLRQKSEEFAANAATQKAATLQTDLHSKQTLEESDDVNTMASDSDIYFESFNDSDLIDLDEDQIIDPLLADFIPKDMQELTIDDLMSVDKGLSASSYLKQCSLFKAQTPSVSNIESNKEPNKQPNKQPSLNNDNVFGIEDKKSAEQYLLEAFGVRK